MTRYILICQPSSLGSSTSKYIRGHPSDNPEFEEKLEMLACTPSDTRPFDAVCEVQQ